MGGLYCLTAVVRKRQVVTLALAISVVAAVFSALTAVQGVINTAATVSEKLAHPSMKLVVSPRGGILECEGILAVNDTMIEIPVIIVNDNASLPGVDRPPRGNASIGYLSAQLAGRKGKAGLIIESRRYTVTIGGVHRANSGLDVSIVVWSRRIKPCTGLHLYRVNASTAPYSETLAAQLSGLVTEWRLAGLAILLAGSITATVKALGDLAKESLILEEEGASARCVRYSLAEVFAASVISGYAWGWVIAGIADSAVASATGVFLPLPRVSLSNIIEAGIAPALMVFLASVIAGGLDASKR